MKINPKVFHIALIIYLLIIFISSSIPGDNFPKVDFEFSDKIVHFIIYSILFILFFYSLKNQTKYTKLQKSALEYSFLFTALYGVTDELHQYFVPHRSCELFDWLADLAGALVVYIPFKIYNSKMKKISIALFIFTFFSCSSSDNKSNNNLKQDENVKVTVSSQEVWLDLMPVTELNKNKLGFMIKLNIEAPVTAGNYNIRDMIIYLNNDTLLNKNFSNGIILETGVKKIDIFQSNDEKYLDNSKALPEEAKFSFSIYKDDNKIKTISTSKLKINRVY